MATSTIPYALVVDDDPALLMRICAILEEAGFRDLKADNGDEAKMVLEDHAAKITLLFSDVEMPGQTNGFALARHVHQHFPWIEIVIASGRVLPSPNDMPPKATFLQKPFDQATLLDHLRETLPDGKKPEPLKSAI